MKMSQFYMCPPTYYDIEYSINPWMDTRNRVVRDRAMVQWATLVDTYERLGMQITIIEPIEGLPELTFPGDSIFLYGDLAIASNYRFEERFHEVPPLVTWFSERGFRIHRLPPDIHFEGNAEAILWRDVILGGYGVRSDLAAYEIISSVLNVDVVPLRLLYPFFHLDIALCPTGDKLIAYYPGAFDQESQATIEQIAECTIKVDKDEALRLACNTITIGDTVMLSSQECPKFKAQLADSGYHVIDLDTSEFHKAGGGVKCLTLERYEPARSLDFA
jgi:N-dimethylarginine dimethylaminohydrolase